MLFCQINLKVTQIATCGLLASTVSDSESDDDAFFGPIACWFVRKDFDGSSYSLPRNSVLRPKKHTLTPQLSVLILYHIIFMSMKRQILKCKYLNGR